MRFLPKKYSVFIFLSFIAAWILFLRWPYFARPAWNLDESIHATIARSILDGGVMYRDSIDQRTPLTYYLVAGLFRLFGGNNMWALQAVLAALIVATAAGIYLIAHRWRSQVMGRWSALVYYAFTTNLLYIGDGAEFSISCILRDGQKAELLRRLLRPVEITADRPEQEFNVKLSPDARELDLSVNNGPAENASSDWTHWVNVELVNSR